MRTYQLYLKDENAWVWVGTLEAATHADAFRSALLCLGSGDDQRPIRIEQDTEGAYHKPIGPRPAARSDAPGSRAEMPRRPDPARVVHSAPRPGRSPR